METKWNYSKWINLNLIVLIYLDISEELDNADDMV